MSNTENNFGWRAILTHGLIYKIVQFVFSEHKSKQLILDDFIVPCGSQCNVLDIGCGPGNLLSFLSDNVNYIGFDMNAEYISLAKQKFNSREKTLFIHGSATQLMNNEALADESIDVVIIHGVLHHVTDQTAEEMFSLARTKLKPGAKMVVLEPVWFDNQSKIRKWVMQKDRGNNIKRDTDWVELFAKLTTPWAVMTTKIEQNLIRFYDLIVLSVEKR